MMSSAVIQVENLGKQYRIRQKQRHKTLREDMNLLVRGLLGRQKTAVSELIWALQDVNFSVNQGEILGVIGRNGAGKSTLLKILSQISKPTQGEVKIRGRVGSLLEVGTGFHPELSGRENIFLNGAILGMPRVEIERKFDEIVAFAEVERFIDTPVKRYSSGMYMRLAFAVAAYLEPEIMIIDEVLAVGDAAFQKKCLGKMGGVAQSGRTVLFVSHNLAAIQDLCQRVLWLENGRIVELGDPQTIISRYLQSTFDAQTVQKWPDRAKAPGDSEAALHRIAVSPVQPNSTASLTVRDPFVIEIEYWNDNPEVYLQPTFYLYNEQGALVCATGAPYLPDWAEHTFETGLIRHRCHIPGDLLNNGVHRALLHLAKNDKTLLRLDNALVFEIHDSADLRDGWYGKWPGAIRPNFKWETDVLA